MYFLTTYSFLPLVAFIFHVILIRLHFYHLNTATSVICQSADQNFNPRIFCTSIENFHRIRNLPKITPCRIHSMEKKKIRNNSTQIRPKQKLIFHRKKKYLFY